MHLFGWAWKHSVSWQNKNELTISNELARGYKESGMAAYSRLQEKEFSREKHYGYAAAKHQRFVGTGYFDEVTQVIAGGSSSTTALKGSTEEEQFMHNGFLEREMKGIGNPACTPVLGECAAIDGCIDVDLVQLKSIKDDPGAAA
jgi:hypothetical protein